MTSEMNVQFTITRVLCLLCVYIRQSVCSCPESFFGFTEVLTCLHNITHGVNGFNILAGTSTETIHKYCLDGTFNQTVACLNGLYTQCQNPKSQAWLKTIAKPYLWQRGINNICSNLQVHSEYNDCILEQRSSVYTCLNYNDERFVEQTTEPKRSWASITFNICRYYKGMRICTGRHVQEKCDVSTGQLLENYIQAITPLLCDQDNPFSAASDQTHQSNYNQPLITLIIALLIILLNLNIVDVR